MAEARDIHPELFDNYGETGRYHLSRPTSIKPSEEEMESASIRLLEAREELAQLNEESRQELSRASRTRGPYEEIYKKHNEYENEIIPDQERKVRDIEQEYAWYRYEQALQAFKDHVEKYGKPKSRKGGMKRRR
jgi:predicted nuclease with TOPRIM domain